MLKGAIVGMGGLGRTHLRGVCAFAEKYGGVEIVALCDIEEAQFHAAAELNIGTSGKVDVSKYRLYTDVDEMLEKEELDFCFTGLPTYEHARIGIKILNKGIHLFSEKPMALTVEECDAMIAAAEKNNCKLMIGQCVRYSPAYGALKEMIEKETYGKLIHVRCDRLSSLPIWSWQHWMEDDAKSGGAALDLHVHDTDMINYIFGIPSSVVSFATHSKTGYDSIHTTFVYDDKDYVVMSTGDWGLANKYSFDQFFRANFEKATVEFTHGKLTVYPMEGVAFEPELPAVDAYKAEAEDFLFNIINDTVSEVNPAIDSRNSLRIALAEKKSASLQGEKVKL